MHRSPAPATPEGRRFRQLMQLGGDGGPRVTLRRRKTWKAPPPASFEMGWLELYRDGRLVALWSDLATIDDLLLRADRRGRYELLDRDQAGLVRSRYAVRFDPKGGPLFDFILVRKPLGKDRSE